MAKIQLLLIQGDTTTDMTALVKSVHWKGRKGSSARTLTVTMIDDNGYKHARSGIDVEDGNQCVFYVDGQERFRGILLNQGQSSKKQLKYTAYDNGIYLANNKDTFVYKNKTADEVFTDVCSRFGIPTGDVAKCNYKIPELTKSKTTGRTPFWTLLALTIRQLASGTMSAATAVNSLFCSAKIRSFPLSSMGTPTCMTTPTLKASRTSRPASR